MLLGVDLMDAREEMFVRMVTDGLSMGVAFMRAGFKSKHTEAPYKLWSLDRIQERAAAILEARRTTGVVTLPQVTSMLQRVYSNAFHNEEFNAAHNAALSLARLYGHVNDRQTLEVIRRPSRDPDAPSEQDLSSWVESLPMINAPAGFSHSVIAPAPAPAPESGDLGPDSALPARLLSEPRVAGIDAENAVTTSPQDDSATAIDWNASPMLPASATSRNMSNNINDLPANMCLGAVNNIARSSDLIASDTIESDGGVPAPGQPENGAPSRPVTVTAPPCGPSLLSGKGAPLQSQQVPVLTGEFPPIEDLF